MSLDELFFNGMVYFWRRWAAKKAPHDMSLWNTYCFIKISVASSYYNLVATFLAMPFALFVQYPLICYFNDSHVYSLGCLGTSSGHVPYMFSLAYTERELVSDVCHIYSGLGPTFTVELGDSFTVGNQKRSTLDTCGYLFLGMVHWHTLCPDQDNDYPTVLYI